MDRLSGSAVFAAMVLSLTLTACGGGGASADITTSPPAGGGGTTSSIEGVSTPSSVSVVTAKNAQ